MMGWIKQHRKALLIAAVIVLVLAASFFLTGNPGTTSKPEKASVRSSGMISSVSSSGEISVQASAAQTEERSNDFSQEEHGSVESEEQTQEKSTAGIFSEPSEPGLSPEQEASVSETSVELPVSSSVVSLEEQPSNMEASYPTEAASSKPSKPDVQPESADQQPAESQRESLDDTTQHRCTVSISCGVLLENADQLRRGKRQLVPTDGVILSACEVSFEEGESVFDVTRRLCQEKKIPFEFSLAPVYHTAYIEGIYNLYEFDCGSGSGWVYVVNGALPSVGCSDWKLQNGDTVEWMYTCALGHDVEEILKERVS